MQQPWSKGIQLLLRLTILEEHEVLLASHKRQTINHKHHTTYKMLLICCGEVNIFKLKPFKESAEVVNDPNAHVSLRNLLLFSIRRTLAAWNHHPETRRHRKNSRKRILWASGEQDGRAHLHDSLAYGLNPLHFFFVLEQCQSVAEPA